MRRRAESKDSIGRRVPRVPQFNPVASVFILLSAFFLASPAEAFEPVLYAVEPLGAQRGKTLTIKLKGEGLTPGAEVITTIPGTFSRLAPPKDLDKPDGELPFLVQLPADASVGVYPIRVRTAEGLSNILLFSV